MVTKMAILSVRLQQPIAFVQQRIGRECLGWSRLKPLINKLRATVENRPVLEEQCDLAVSPDALFSNLNPATLKHEPGSVLGSLLLISGTTVRARY